MQDFHGGICPISPLLASVVESNPSGRGKSAGQKHSSEHLNGDLLNLPKRSFPLLGSLFPLTEYSRELSTFNLFGDSITNDTVDFLHHLCGGLTGNHQGVILADLFGDMSK